MDNNVGISWGKADPEKYIIKVVFLCYLSNDGIIRKWDPHWQYLIYHIETSKGGYLDISTYTCMAYKPIKPDNFQLNS